MSRNACSEVPAYTPANRASTYGAHANPERSDGTPNTLVLLHCPCPDRQTALLRQRSNPQVTMDHGAATPPAPSEQLLSSRHNILSRQPAVTMVTSKDISSSDHAPSPPRSGQPGKPHQQRRGNTISRAKCSTRKCPQRVSATSNIGSNDTLHQQSRKRRRGLGQYQDELWTRWRRLNDGGRGRKN